MTVPASAELTNDKGANAKLIEPIGTRTANVLGFLAEAAPNISVDTPPITDPFGPTITEPDYDAIIVSSETAGGGEAVNTKRAERGFRPLQVLVTRRLGASTLSSTYIRNWVARL